EAAHGASDQEQLPVPGPLGPRLCDVLAQHLRCLIGDVRRIARREHGDIRQVLPQPRGLRRRAGAVETVEITDHPEPSDRSRLESALVVATAPTPERLRPIVPGWARTARGSFSACRWDRARDAQSTNNGCPGERSEAKPRLSLRA